MEDILIQGMSKLISSKKELILLENYNITLNPILEATWRELRDNMERGRLKRSKHLHVQYLGVMNKKGWITFRTKSQTNPRKYYTQYIKLLDMKDLDYVKDLTKKEIIRLMLSGDIAVYCNCPDFLYKGYKYMGYNMGYGFFREMRFPKKRNPNLEGTVCKHLGAVLSVYMMHWTSIYKDMTKTVYWKSRYEE